MKKIILFLILGWLGNAYSAVAGELLIVAGPNFSAQKEVTTELLRLAFLGKPAALPNAGIQLRAIERAEYKLKSIFYKQILSKTNIEMKAYWSEQIFTSLGYPPPHADNLADLKKMLSDSKDEVSYIDSEEDSKGFNVIMRVHY